MDTDVYFDIPIFKTLPKIISDNNSDLLPNIKLSNIYVEKDYQLEPFSNIKDNYLIILFFVILFFIILLYLIMI